MSRLHGRAGRTDWVLEMDREYPSYNYAFASPVRYRLSLRLTSEQANALVSQAGRLGDVHVAMYPGSDLLFVSGIELTAEEADQLAHRQRSPLDILFPVWPELGYKLVAVPDPAVA